MMPPSDSAAGWRSTPNANGNGNNNNNNNNAENGNGNADGGNGGRITNQGSQRQQQQQPLQQQQMNWSEREQRQRSVRFMMMFLLMLLLMDGEEDGARRPRMLRKRNPPLPKLMNHTTYKDRRAIDERIFSIVTSTQRYGDLVAKNGNTDHDLQTRDWAQQSLIIQEDGVAQLPTDLADPKAAKKRKNGDAESENETEQNKKKVHHYPWNATGLYRGDWVITHNVIDMAGTPSPSAKQEGSAVPGAASQAQTQSQQQSMPPAASTLSQTNKVVTPRDVESIATSLLAERNQKFGILLLPDGMEMAMPNATAASNHQQPGAKSQQSWPRQEQSLLLGSKRSKSKSDPKREPNHKVTLTKDSGKIAFQLSARAVPGMEEISLVDGYIKLYDSTTSGYSTSRDLLLPTTGILIHSVGQLSLVANAKSNRTVFAMTSHDDPSLAQRRRLLDAEISSILNNEHDCQFPNAAACKSYVNSERFEQVRTMVLDELALPPTRPDERSMIGLHAKGAEGAAAADVPQQHSHRRLLDAETEGVSEVSDRVSETTTLPNDEQQQATSSRTDDKSDTVFAFPYIPEDPQSPLQRERPPAKMPTREQQLEINSGDCEFEINMNVEDVEVELGGWRKLVMRYAKEITNLNPVIGKKIRDSVEKKQKERSNSQRSKKSSPTPPRSKQKHDQASLAAMNGTIISRNCAFEVSVNVTAIRTDWRQTTNKAMNYSFYMMLTCLAQIFILFRQLLHTQAQSAAARVSLLCIGWHTAIDALYCLIHIYLSLAITPALTAFASVVFFKLVLYCGIEMRYMGIILRARISRNSSITSEQLRKQVAMLQLRFYVAFVGMILLSFYVTEYFRVLYVLALYSFWVPQIIRNVITEAKRPIHPYFLFGMSLTRLVAPTYILAMPDTFLKEVYPESPQSILMVELLVLWVGIQTAVLYGQSRYGARFMIPARFLPPKFDYNRPIPPSLLPSDMSGSSSSSSSSSAIPTTPSMSSSATGTTTRNRNRGRQRNGGEGSTIGSNSKASPGSSSSSTSTATSSLNSPCIECIICCNGIDVQNQSGYMLAPCDHIFHKECLTKWMDVKMECPVCRTALPTI